MKKFTLRLIAFVIIISSNASVFAQKVYTGAEAAKKYKYASLYRDSKFSTLPSYIKFKSESQPDIDVLPKWMQSSFKFDPNMGFVLLRKEIDNLGHTHYRYQQTYNGTPIEDAIWIAHTKSDKVYSLNGLIYDKIPASTALGISEAAALEKAKEHIGATTYKWELPGEEKHLKWESDDQSATYFPTAEKVFATKNFSFLIDDYRMAYKFNIYAHKPLYRAEIYIDANTGEVLRENKLIHCADVAGTAHTAYSGEKEIIADSFGGDGEFRLRDGSRGDGVRTFDLNEAEGYGDAVDFVDDDNDWNNVNPEQDEVATDAHWGCEMTYDYYLLEHGRNSLDNDGFQLNSYVHYGTAYDNAFWDGSRMTYGDGNVAFTPLTALDVAGHEVTHGLTTYTAGLVYAAESGALNESFSDIFGTAIEHYAREEEWDWLIGLDIGIFGPLRSMSNPNDRGDPDTYFGDYWADLDGGDSGGVHTNSGVQNHWYYLLTEGGTGTNDNGDDFDVTAVGFEASSAIAFRNLTVYLTSSSQFADARFYSIESAVDLFGNCTFEVEQTANAWYAVGVGDIYNPVTEANFTTPDVLGCAIPHTVNFTNTSTNALTYSWDFGDGTTSTEEDPTHVYTEEGTYTVTLFADGGDCGTDEIIMVDYIIVDPTVDCVVILPEDGEHVTQTGCDGTVFDSGGPSEEYGANEDAWVTISPYGAISVDLTFTMFDVEYYAPGAACDYDYVEIYDGEDIFAPLIGRYCNNNLPSDMTSSGSSITILFHSDGGLEEAGFEIEWSCNMPEFAPDADFMVNNEESCTGLVYFTDLSTNVPTSWAWDFGDGEFSDVQNPEHLYTSDGTYTVTLTATNIVGDGTETKVDYVVVNYPEAPIGTDDEICLHGSATLTASGDGELTWYDSPISETPIETGPTFTTPFLDITTSYWVQNDIYVAPLYVGPIDNTFGGGGYFSGDQHLVFNNPTPVTLVSVDVYANGTENRTIELRNNVGDIIDTRVVNIPDGASTVVLDMEIPAGTNLQLGTALGSEPALYRNNSGFPDYPFTLDGSIEILSSSAGNEYYYFFYNWEIQTDDCTSERTEVQAIIVDCLSVGTESIDNVTIYPNPTSGLLTINTGGIDNGLIIVKDVLGKTVVSLPYYSNTTTIDLNKYQARGTYFVELYDANQNLITVKKIVKH